MAFFRNVKYSVMGQIADFTSLPAVQALGVNLTSLHLEGHAELPPLDGGKDYVGLYSLMMNENDGDLATFSFVITAVTHGDENLLRMTDLIDAIEDHWKPQESWCLRPVKDATTGLEVANLLVTTSAIGPVAKGELDRNMQSVMFDAAVDLSSR